MKRRDFMSKTVGNLALNEQMALPTGRLNVHAPVGATPVVVFPKEVIEERPYEKDDATSEFVEMSEMLDFLWEREHNAGWEIEIPSRSFSLDVQTNPLKNTTGLILKNRGALTNYMPLRDCAIPTMLDRARIGGTALNHVTREVFRDIVNECFLVAPKDATAKVRYADEKISAVLSSHYVPLDMPEIFEIAADEIHSRFPRNIFAGGQWSHSITSCEWALEGENSLVDAYKQALDRHGVDNDYISPGLRLSSSDVGISGVNLMPKLIIGKNRVFLPLGGVVGLEHKTGASMQKFRENLGGVFGQYRDKLANLASLLDVGIAYPEGCFAAITKRLGIPKKYADPAREAFAFAFYDGSSCTAHDVYCGLGELLFQMQISGATGEQMLRMEDSIARALTLNFRDYDKPLKDE